MRLHRAKKPAKYRTMHYQWAKQWLENDIKQRFPAVAGPSVLRARAEELLLEASSYKEQAIAALGGLQDTFTASVLDEEANALEQYALHLRQRADAEDGQEMALEHLEHLALQRRRFVGRVLAHSLLSQATDGDAPQEDALRAAVEEFAHRDSRRALRRAARRTAVDFGFPSFTSDEAKRAVCHARRALLSLLRMAEGDDEA